MISTPTPLSTQPPLPRPLPRPGPLRELGYGGQVRLAPGRFADRLANAAETYGQIPVDNILKGFRRHAGLAAPGDDLTGWASRTTEATFGQWVSGIARLSAVFGDSGLAQRAADLVDGYAATVPASGDTGMHIYGWEKLVCGLVDAAGYAGHADALTLLGRVVRGARFDQTRMPAVPNDFAGDGPERTLEWYTLPENLYRGYLAGGDGALAEYASIWHYDAYWNRFLHRPRRAQPEPVFGGGEHVPSSSARAQPEPVFGGGEHVPRSPSGETWDVPVWLHAYSHLNTFASAAAAYAVHGEPKYLTILRNAYDWATQTQCFATGGYGPSELTVPDDGTLGRTLEWRTDSAEIVCGSWAAFKLCTALLTLTGEARYADWVELLLYSGLGATTPVQPSGRTPYYADYRLGVATKLPFWDDWPCCSGTYVQAVAHIPDLVYFASDETAADAADAAGGGRGGGGGAGRAGGGGDEGLAVALYLPSEVTWTHAGQQVTVSQRTQFPDSDESVLRVVADRPVELTLRLRVPFWTQGMSVECNGERLAVPCVPGAWAVVRRTWQPTDELVVRLGAGLRVVPVDRFHHNRVAVAYGPVVLAQDADWSSPFTAAVPWEMVDWDSVLRREGSGLLFRPVAAGTHRQPVGPFRPFSDVPERRPYRIYHDLDRPRLL